MFFTLRELEERLSQRIGDYFAGTTTTIGNAGGTTLISTDLLLQPGQSWIPFICELVASGLQRVIADYTVAAAVATLTVANTFGAQVASGLAFRIHKLPVAEKYRAINAVLRGLANIIPVEIQEILVSGECLRNPHMEFWRSESAPFDWETVAGTVARERSNVYDGQNSLKLTGTGTAGSLRQYIPLERELAGVTLTLEGYVYGTAGANVLIKIAQGATSDSEALGASNAWTKLSASITLTGGASSIHRRPVVTLQNTTAAATYFDALRLSIPTSNQCYWLPYSDIYHHLARVEIGPRWDVAQTLADSFDLHEMPDYYANGYAWFPGAGGHRYPYPELINQGAQGILPSPYWMRLTGVGHWPTVSAATDSIELSEEQAEYVVLKAAMRLCVQGMGGQYMSDPDYWKNLQTEVAAEVARLEPDVRKARPGIKIKYWR